MSIVNVQGIRASQGVQYVKGIRSMSKEELITTLTGGEIRFSDSSFSKMVPLNDRVDIGERVDVLKSGDASMLSELKLNKGEIDSKIRFDRFEHSDYSINLAEAEAAVQNESFDRTGINDLFSAYGYGYAIGKTTDKQLAEYLGSIGKRLDAAYAEGKFTEKEYSELNASLDEYIESRTRNEEWIRAIYKMGQEEDSSVKKPVHMNLVGDIKCLIAKRDAKINEYAEKYTKIERDILLNLINMFRYGK